MAVVYVGEIALEKLFHQPESRFEIARDGTVRATEVYVCRTASMVKFSYQLAQSVHPMIPYLGVDGVEAEEQEGGQSRLVVKYAGYNSGASGGAQSGGFTETFSLRRNVSTEPIETHKYLTGLTFSQRADVEAALNELQTSKTAVKQKPWMSFNGDGKPANAQTALFYYKARGQESYFEPRVEFTRRRVMDSRSNFARNQAVGFIDVPPAKAPKYGDRNWLYKGSDEAIEGFSYRVDDVWELSGPLKWDEILYRKS